MGLWTLTRAVFYDDDGEEVKKKLFKSTHGNFKDGKRSYIIDLKQSSYFELRGVIWNTRYYSYQLNNPMPMLLNKKHEPIINTELLNIQLENKVARDLNRVGDNKLSELFTPRNMIYLGIGLLAIWFFWSGHKLF